MTDSTHKEWLHEYFDALDFTVYADFNCPFCYALNERLFALGLENRVDFRLIQHKPEANRENIDLTVLSELTTEVAEVRRRLPSVEINIPMFRPNTAPPTALVYKISREDPFQAVQLRRRIYSALWVDGQDISDADLLASLLLELDIELSSTKVALSNADLCSWQSEWENNIEFDRQLPILISESGETVIGSLLEPELDAFLASGSLVSEEVSSRLWQPPRRQRILVLENEAECVRSIVEQMHDAQVEVVDDIIALIAHVRNLGTPDLLLANADLIQNVDGPDWWRNATNSDPDPAVPVIYLLNQSEPKAQAVAFAGGATDLITKPFHPRLLRTRLNTYLESRRLQLKFKQIARVDALTSISSRLEFDDRLTAEWGRNSRSGESLAVLMIDVDRLRAYNDSFGHLQGDECLVDIAQRLSGSLQRSGDLVARYEGGLFAALLPGTELNSALKVARDCEQIVAQAERPHPTSTVAPRVSISIGVSAMVPMPDKPSSLLLEQAEIALYQAKQQRRSRVCAFEEFTGKVDSG